MSQAKTNNESFTAIPSFIPPNPSCNNEVVVIVPPIEVMRLKKLI